MHAPGPALVVLAVLVAAPAGAQVGPSALRGHDTSAPIDVDAQRIEVRDPEGLAIFSGDVKVKQGALNLQAQTLRVSYRREGDSPVIRRLDAQGGVRLTSPSERAQAAYGIYDVERRIITLVGSVVLNQGQSVLRGERLAIDLTSGRSALDARASGPLAGAATGSGGRVTGRFVVPERAPRR
jgi:lipopolysaccharide export system protein LptA